MIKFLISGVIFITLFFFPFNLYGKTLKLEIPQIVSMYTAVNEGNNIHWKGDTYPKTLCGILWQETKAGYSKYRKNGYVLGDKDQSIGPMQVQVRTARWIGEKYPNLFIYKFNKSVYDITDNEIKNALMKDEVWNIKVGATYFSFLLEYMGDYNQAILAYNKGP
ncbi:MAG TPA: transglycosylase SLT domain-containing protein, partial [Bacteroidales bacterium]|nr:transglycosylase SLT domain-containing protein [Bacteroidales bacterium]